jgi:hypothetical protein
MNSSFQQRFIAQHLQDTFGHHGNWPFCSAAEIEGSLVTADLRLAVGDYLVVSMDRNGARCRKMSTLEDLATTPSDSLVIPYHKLERAFHEQYAEYVEL